MYFIQGVPKLTKSITFTSEIIQARISQNEINSLMNYFLKSQH